MSIEQLISERDMFVKCMDLLHPDVPVVEFSGRLELSQTRRGVWHADLETVHEHYAIGDEAYVSTSRVVAIHLMIDGNADVLLTKNTLYVRRDMPKDL